MLNHIKCTTGFKLVIEAQTLNNFFFFLIGYHVPVKKMILFKSYRSNEYLKYDIF